MRQIQCSDPEILGYLAKDLPKPPLRSLPEGVRSLLKEPEIPLSTTTATVAKDESSDSDCDESDYVTDSECESDSESD